MATLGEYLTSWPMGVLIFLILMAIILLTDISAFIKFFLGFGAVVIFIGLCAYAYHEIFIGDYDD